MTVLVETRADFTLETARRVVWNGEGVELGAKALAAMQQGRQRLERILDHDPEVTIYGVTAGVGHYARKKLSSDEREQWANLSMARIAASWGDPLRNAASRRRATICSAKSLKARVGPWKSSCSQRFGPSWISGAVAGWSKPA